MVDLQTTIDELNTGKIEFDYKDDDCCTTEGEVVILLKRLAELEKADFVEVVHCADCKHLVVYDNYCMYFGHKTNDNDFCSYGKRREN